MIRFITALPELLTVTTQFRHVHRINICHRFYRTSTASRCDPCSLHKTDSRRFQEERHQQSSSYDQHRHHYRHHSRHDGRRRSANNGGAAPIFFLPALSTWSTIKYRLGLEKPKLDEDEIKNMVKYAMVYCREQQFDEALAVLHEALHKCEETKNENGITYCLDMMANIYYFVGRYDEAEQTFASVIQRILSSKDNVDGVSPEKSPAMVELSLKLADVYAMKGEDEKAISGFEFCVATQKANVEREIAEHNRKYVKRVGADRHEHELEPGTDEPFALYGLVLETYARYLVRKGRVDESTIYLNRALEMALEIYGATHPHTLSVMNNFAILCISQKRFDVAEKYLKDVVTRAPLLEDAGEAVTGYYTNYAEVLWHLGRHEESLEYARRAAKLATDKSVPEEARKRTKEYLAALEADWAKEKKKRK